MHLCDVLYSIGIFPEQLATQIKPLKREKLLITKE